MSAVVTMSVASRGLPVQSAASGESAVTTSLRYYFAGDASPGLFPAQLNGQAEILKVTAITPQALSLK